MSRTCRWVLGAFGLSYLAALGLLAVGTFGWLGQEKDPLSGIFLLPLGLPWNLLGERLPETALPWLGAGAPLANLLLLWGVCRAVGAGRRS